MHFLGLPELRAGDTRTVSSVHGGNVALKRLADLGFVRGASLTMVAPGRPCIVRIDDRLIGLGDAYQRSIAVNADLGEASADREEEAPARP